MLRCVGRIQFRSSMLKGSGISCSFGNRSIDTIDESKEDFGDSAENESNEEAVKLHPHWEALENRVRNRKPRMDGPSGRGKTHATPWDASNGQS